MKRAGTSRGQVAVAVLVVALVALGGFYVASLPPKTSSSSTVQTSTTTRTSAPTSTTVTSSSAQTSSHTSGQASSSSTASSTSTPSTYTSTSGPISHVIIVLMENEEYGNVIGSASAPYENKLASTYALAADYFGVAHPSLPNYLALVGGSTFGVTSDCLPSGCSLSSNVTSIATLLDSHHLSWKEYAESMPTNCSQVVSPDGLYVTKHNPFVYFGAITGNSGAGSTSGYCQSHVVSMSQFYLDLQAGDLPNYSFVTPNLCDDAHSCPLSAGDQWLSTFIPRVVNSSSFHSTAVFITYDEGSTSDTTAGGGQVACIVVSPFARPGYVSHTEYTHYSLLATVEGIFNLGSLGRGDASAKTMSDLFSPSAQVP